MEGLLRAASPVGRSIDAWGRHSYSFDPRFPQEVPGREPLRQGSGWSPAKEFDVGRPLVGGAIPL